MTAADVAVVEAMLRVELSAFLRPESSEEHEAAETGSVRCDRLIHDVQSFMSALIKPVAAFGVVTALHPLMLPVLVLTVLPSGASSTDVSVCHTVSTAMRAAPSTGHR